MLILIDQQTRLSIKIRISYNRKYKYISLNKYQKSKTLKVTLETAKKILNYQKKYNTVIQIV